MYLFEREIIQMNYVLGNLSYFWVFCPHMYLLHSCYNPSKFTKCYARWIQSNFVIQILFHYLGGFREALWQEWNERVPRGCFVLSDHIEVLPSPNSAWTLHSITNQAYKQLAMSRTSLFPGESGIKHRPSSVTAPPSGESGGERYGNVHYDAVTIRIRCEGGPWPDPNIYGNKVPKFID